MFWLDRVYEELAVALKDKIASGKTLLIRDEKTASGRVHVGSMRALALHAAIAERLEEAGLPHVFKFEINDMDPMDGLPSYLDRAEYERHMGKPLYTIPSPDGTAKNFAEYFGQEYIEAILAAGFAPEFYRASELYLGGKMNGLIRTALDRADIVRTIYEDIYHRERPKDWYPLYVVCEHCGKLGTTKVVAWDGERVTYRCEPRAVEWAAGCGQGGTVSPFDGRAKFPWKLDWAAKWAVVGVDIEGGGKDHYSKGGARDVARRISQEVFDYPEPFGVPNEFFLVGGAKMSSSKGSGASAKSIVELVPPHIFKLALYSKDINQQINFDPEGDTIPALYDLYDKLAHGYWAGVRDDFSRLFEFVHPHRTPPAQSALPRFSQVAFMVQMPHLDLYKEFPDADRAELDERAAYAKRWIERYAPERYVFKLQETLPDAAQNLPESAKAALKALHDFIAARETMPSGEELHAELHKTKEFKAIYLAFLGKESGPKAGWFLSVLERSFVLNRLAEAAR